jgi:Cyclin D1 binding domain
MHSRRYLAIMAGETLERGLQRRALDLSGEWLGYYTGHFDEVVKIKQDGDYVEAVKVTGDDYVPADEITWRANIRTGKGEGQIAEREFRNSRFVPGRLQIISPNKLVFTWENCGEVEFRRDDY